MKSAGRFELHLAEQLVIEVGEFQPTDVCGQVEGAFEKRQQPADQQRGDHRRANRGGAARTEELQMVHRVRPENRCDV